MYVSHGKFQGETFEWVCDQKLWYVRWLCEQPAGNMVKFFPLINYYKNRTQRLTLHKRRKSTLTLPAGLRDMGEALP